jgi:rubrerythrin
MSDYSIQEIIEQAIQTEKLGYEFYNSLAARFSDDDKIRVLFEFLAGQELKHEKTFSGLMDNLPTDDFIDWDEASYYLRAIVESEFFLGSKKALPSIVHITNRNDALHQAMLFEKETLLYFYSMRDLVDEWKVLDEIINEEKSHIKQIAQMMI